jgi:hypothetical protein
MNEFDRRKTVEAVPVANQGDGLPSVAPAQVECSEGQAPADRMTVPKTEVSKKKRSTHEQIGWIGVAEEINERPFKQRIPERQRQGRRMASLNWYSIDVSN